MGDIKRKWKVIYEKEIKKNQDDKPCKNPYSDHYCAGHYNYSITGQFT